jgi:hypothetical protein
MPSGTTSFVPPVPRLPSLQRIDPTDHASLRTVLKGAQTKGAVYFDVTNRLSRGHRLKDVGPENDGTPPAINPQKLRLLAKVRASS